MIQLAVCDENAEFRANVCKCWNACLKEQNINYVITEYKSGEELLKGTFPDVLLLNTNLKITNGILVKEILYQMRANTRILFVSENKNSMKDAFGKNVFGYLVKPLHSQQLYDVTMKMIEDRLRDMDSFYYLNRGIYKKANFKDIICVESRGRYTKIYLENVHADVIFKKTLREWYEQLPNEYFVFGNRKWIFNRLFLSEVSLAEETNRVDVTLKNGVKIRTTESVGNELRKESLEEMRKRGIMT